MSRIRSTKKNNYVVQFRENSGLVCEWELREANLLIYFAGAQLFKAFRGNVIKTGISELVSALALLLFLFHWRHLYGCVVQWVYNGLGQADV